MLSSEAKKSRMVCRQEFNLWWIINNVQHRGSKTAKVGDVYTWGYDESYEFRILVRNT
jgi:hypothetical protein